jgi:histidyl-tRNA synthetase
MSIQKPTIPKGTRDFGPAEVQKRKYILNTIETVFKKYGFMPIETPTMENLSTLEGKYGDEGDKLLFRVLNSGDAFKEIKEKNREEKMSNVEFRTSNFSEKGLRYDLTVPFARYVVMNRNEITFPFKRYQMQPVWRADRPQKGRYREFWQCDADVVGSDSLLNELDLIQIYDEVFHRLGIKVDILFNNRKFLNGVVAYICKGEEARYLDTIGHLDKLDKIDVESLAEQMLQNGYTIEQVNRFKYITLQWTTTNLNEDLINDLIKHSGDNNKEMLAGLDEVKFIMSNTSKLSNLLQWKITLARGLSYYTGCIFEVVSTEGSLKSSIGGGGRYDNLTGIFGLPNVSGVGISFGLDRIYDVMDELNLFPHGLNKTSTQVLICAFDEPTQMSALAILKKLRDTQIASELYPELPQSKKDRENPLQKPMNYADALHIPFRLIIKQDSMLLKDIKGVVIPVSTVEDIINQIK